MVIGAGHAGLSTSYWLTQSGVEHLVVDGRGDLGGSWPDRWDSFCLVAPNFTLLLPGQPYSGPEPDAFMPRDGVVSADLAQPQPTSRSCSQPSISMPPASRARSSSASQTSSTPRP